MSEHRVRYADLRPYIVPDHLDDLRGPKTGVIELPKHLDWSEQGRYNLDDRRELALMYERVVREALDPNDLRRYLNASLLIELWPVMFLPARVRELWERKFPEMRRAA